LSIDIELYSIAAEFDGKTRVSICIVSTTVEKIERVLFGKQPFAYVLLIKDKQQTIGFALYHIRYSSFSGLPSIWLDDLFVNNRERSIGGGLQIMKALTKEADELGHLKYLVQQVL
jgi:hypothetical protein